MKKLFTSLILLHFAFSGNAQLSVGATAPDFTLTDIDGNTHTLYEYLDQGYSVVLDISATWCGPCWYFHEQHVLKDLYEKYGPEGTIEAGKIMPIFVEGDNTTTMADLQGTTSSTQGDWITGSPYPIIDDASLNAPYTVGGFPSVMLICPDRKVVAATGSTLPAAIFTDEYWSSKAEECVGTTGIHNPGLPNLNLKVYPTPTNGNLNLSMSLDKQMQLDISVVDMLGKQVLTMDPMDLNGGAHTVHINAAHLPAGTYTVWVQSNEGSARVKFVKQ